MDYSQFRRSGNVEGEADANYIQRLANHIAEPVKAAYDSLVTHPFIMDRDFQKMMWEKQYPIDKDLALSPMASSLGDPNSLPPPTPEELMRQVLIAHEGG